MKLGRLGVWYPTDRLDGPGLRALMRTIEGNGYSAFWYPESRGYESMSLADYLLGCSEKLVIGSSIANIYARDAFTARRATVSMNALHGDRFILGLGVSHIPMVEGLRGHRYDKPLGALRRRVRDAQDKVATLMARQGHVLEAMAVQELDQRRARLEEYQVQARFALAESYDKADKDQEGGTK